MAEQTAWLSLLATIAATYLFRLSGTAMAGRIDVTSPVFEWFTAIAYAMTVGLAARLVVLPAGSLEATPMPDRLLAVLAGVAVCLALGRRLMPGLLAGAVVFGALQAWRTGAF